MLFWGGLCLQGIHVPQNSLINTQEEELIRTIDLNEKKSAAENVQSLVKYKGDLTTEKHIYHYYEIKHSIHLLMK